MIEIGENLAQLLVVIAGMCTFCFFIYCVTKYDK